MMYVVINLCLILSFAACFCKADGSFSYQDQSKWNGICVSGNNMMQSPIDIVTKDVKKNSSLTTLQFNSAWSAQSSGTIMNTGASVQFTPTNKNAAIDIKFLGIYTLQQVHVHWGPRTGMGSEHRINGQQAELEIHFATFKQGTDDSTQRDFVAGIGVLADVVDGPISGVWAKWNVSAVQQNGSTPVSVSGLVISDLLPADRSYYYYMGSFTTPPCSEIVQWFLLKNRVKVPSAFLSQLRMVQGKDGQDLQTNFRNVQPLEGRVVMEASQSFNKPAMLIILITLSLAKFL